MHVRGSIICTRAATKFMVHQSKVSGNWEVNKSELHVFRISAGDVSTVRRPKRSLRQVIGSNSCALPKIAITHNCIKFYWWTINFVITQVYSYISHDYTKASCKVIIDSDD